MTQHDPLTLLRFLFAYPVMIVCGVTWGVLFLHRARLSKPASYTGDYLVAALSFAVALTGVGGFAGLLYSRLFGFGLVSSGFATLGAVSVAVVLLVGVLYMFRVNWRLNKGG